VPTGAPADTFTCDPADPTHLIDSLTENRSTDYTQLNATHRDALVFTRSPLAAARGDRRMAKGGRPTTRAIPTGPSCCCVFPDGHAERVQDGLARARFRQGMDREVPLVPGQLERYDIDLWFTSKVFQPGHRLRVSIASALFPKYDRNLNTGGNNERDSTFVVAHQRLVHDAAHPTHVVLPVIPR
jgi:putative CocE/NonD family hydrolase